MKLQVRLRQLRRRYAFISSMSFFVVALTAGAEIRWSQECSIFVDSLRVDTPGVHLDHRGL
jgi:hypothetical protein